MQFGAWVAAAAMGLSLTTAPAQADVYLFQTPASVTDVFVRGVIEISPRGEDNGVNVDARYDGIPVDLRLAGIGHISFRARFAPRSQDYWFHWHSFVYYDSPYFRGLPWHMELATPGGGIAPTGLIYFDFGPEIERGFYIDLSPLSDSKSVGGYGDFPGLYCSNVDPNLFDTCNFNALFGRAADVKAELAEINVPEPSTMFIFGAALAIGAAARRRRRTNPSGVVG